MKFPWKRQIRSQLDDVLWSWSGVDPMQVRSLLKNVAILGGSGSGKTSSSGRLIGRSIVGHRNSGGLIISAKRFEDAAMWRRIFAEAGRADDLVVVSPEDIRRMNFLDYLARQGADTRQVTRCLMAIAETLRASDGRAGEDSDFWEQGKERVLYNAVEMIRLGGGDVSAPLLQRFINTAAYEPAQLTSAEWQAGYHNQTLRAAFERPKTAAEQYDFELAFDFWTGEFPQMSSRTRSSILAGVMNLLHVFNTGLVREMVSTVTNVSPDDTLKRKFVLVDMPPSAYGDAGALVSGGWKFLTQWRLLRRRAEPDDCVHVIWVDEAGQFVNGHDSHYLAQCRSRNACMVFLAQSIHSYYAALPGEAGRHQADALMSNFAFKVFHACGDVQTAEMASNLVGKSLQTFVGGSMSPHGEMWDELTGQTRFTGSFSQHFESVVQPAEFMNGLRTGGRANGMVCDAIVVKTGEPFASGANWMEVAFSQQ